MLPSMAHKACLWRWCCGTHIAVLRYLLVELRQSISIKACSPTAAAALLKAVASRRLRRRRRRRRRRHRCRRRRRRRRRRWWLLGRGSVLASDTPAAGRPRCATTMRPSQTALTESRPPPLSWDGDAAHCRNVCRVYCASRMRLSLRRPCAGVRVVLLVRG
jgi:hypothetical protein